LFQMLPITKQKVCLNLGIIISNTCALMRIGESGKIRFQVNKMDGQTIFV
jgi:hypothetical protein